MVEESKQMMMIDQGEVTNGIERPITFYEKKSSF